MPLREPCQMGNQAALSGIRDVLRGSRPDSFLMKYRELLKNDIQYTVSVQSIYFRPPKSGRLFNILRGEGQHGASGDIQTMAADDV